MRRIQLKTFFLVSLIILDICGLILAFQSAFWTRFFSAVFIRWFPPIKGIPNPALYQHFLLTLLPVYVLVFFYLGLYRDMLSSAYDEFVQVTKAVLLCSLVATAMTFSIRGVEYSRLVIGLWALYSVAFLYLLREFDKFLFRKIKSRAEGPHHVLVIGKGKVLDAIREMMPKQPFVETSFIESIPDAGVLEHHLRKHKTSEVVFVQSGLPSLAILEASRVCENMQVECKVVPDILEMRRGEIIVDGFCGLPTFQIKSVSLHGSNYLVKRGFDIIVSLGVVSVLFLPLLLISVLISLDSPGPVLFSQDRMGLLGRKFKLYKFRTMVVDADTHIDKLKHLSDRSGPVFKMKDDPRVTRVGNWLRRFSLDEIPQIMNVLKGDMSLVGPRPQVLWEAAHYDDHAKKRLRIMPGITGLWQVSGRAALSYEEMINLDIFYLENWSLGLDLKIILRTLPAIFNREGAY